MMILDPIEEQEKEELIDRVREDINWSLENNLIDYDLALYLRCNPQVAIEWHKIGYQAC